MNRKTMSIVLLALAVAAAGAFASGKKEDQTRQPGPGAGPCPGCFDGPGPGRGAYGPGAEDGLKFAEDKVTLTGELYFQNRMHAELKAGGKDYELMVPRFYFYDLELKEGQKVSVEGFVAAGEDENYLWVTKAVIDGKEYDLERRGPAMSMMGPRGGRGGRGGGRGGWR